MATVTMMMRPSDNNNFADFAPSSGSYASDDGLSVDADSVVGEWGKRKTMAIPTKFNGFRDWSAPSPSKRARMGDLSVLGVLPCSGGSSNVSAARRESVASIAVSLVDDAFAILGGGDGDGGRRASRRESLDGSVFSLLSFDIDDLSVGDMDEDDIMRVTAGCGDDVPAIITPVDDDNATGKSVSRKVEMKGFLARVDAPTVYFDDDNDDEEKVDDFDIDEILSCPPKNDDAMPPRRVSPTTVTTNNIGRPQQLLVVPSAMSPDRSEKNRFTGEHRPQQRRVPVPVPPTPAVNIRSSSRNGVSPPPAAATMAQLERQLATLQSCILKTTTSRRWLILHRPENSMPARRNEMIRRQQIYDSGISLCVDQLAQSMVSSAGGVR